MLAGGGLLALAGCLPNDEPRPRASAPPEVRLRARVADEVVELGGSYAAVLARFPAAGATLSPLAAEHSAHVEALRRPTPEPTGTASPGPTEPPEPPIPATLPAAVGMLASAERAASARRVRQARGTTPGTARLLASIAACEAAHAALLEEGQ